MKVSRWRNFTPFKSFFSRKVDTMRPLLCRVRAYSCPGLPKPTMIYISLLCQIKLDNTILANYGQKLFKFLERICQTRLFFSFDSDTVPFLHCPALYRRRRIHGSDI